MPWKASSVMEERLRFVARLLDGEAMTDVCRDLGTTCHLCVRAGHTRSPPDSGWRKKEVAIVLALTQELVEIVLGPGIVARVCAEVQKAFIVAPPADLEPPLRVIGCRTGANGQLDRP